MTEDEMEERMREAQNKLGPIFKGMNFSLQVIDDEGTPWTLSGYWADEQRTIN